MKPYGWLVQCAVVFAGLAFGLARASAAPLPPDAKLTLKGLPPTVVHEVEILGVVEHGDPAILHVEASLTDAAGELRVPVPVSWKGDLILRVRREGRLLLDERLDRDDLLRRLLREPRRGTARSAARSEAATAWLDEVTSTEGGPLSSEAAALPWGETSANLCPANVCEYPDEDGLKKMIIGCDDRLPGPRESTRGRSPWQMVGLLVAPGTGGCTGTLIAPRFVLTAAHCLLNNDSSFRTGSLRFELGHFSQTISSKPAACEHPYGTHYAKKAWVPEGYVFSELTPTNSSHDWALVELANPIAGGVAMPFDDLPWGDLVTKTPYSIGYPGDSANAGQAWEVGSKNRFLATYTWNGGARGVFYTTIDAVAGQSGSPVYIFQPPGDGDWTARASRRVLVGVLVGSSPSHCRAGRVWASRLTSNVVQFLEDLTGDEPVFYFGYRSHNYTIRPDVPPPSINECFGGF